jgi:predicted transposase YbfD/YdcC
MALLGFLRYSGRIVGEASLWFDYSVPFPRSFGMDAQATAKILCAFADLPDPRDSNRSHKFTDILTIALFAVLCGADGWVAVAQYGRCKLDWLKTFLELPRGIPSHDTFGKLFARLKPEALEQCFQKWMAALVDRAGGRLIAIDGKSLRRSFEHGWDKSGMAHMVSAFVAANHLVLAQVKTEGKGQELEGILQLLALLDLEGAVVTIDALGCQKDIAQEIRAGGGQYILQVKDNQPTLLGKLKITLDDCILDGFAGMASDFFCEVDGDHGRIETRKLWVCWDVKLLGKLREDWCEVRSLIAVERTREVGGKSSIERHYYISSLDKRTKAKTLAGLIRGHWRVENNLHWQLDVSFAEDERRIRKDHGAENYSRLCRISLNLLKNETTQKTGIAIKRQICGWNNEYLLKVVNA